MSEPWVDVDGAEVALHHALRSNSGKPKAQQSLTPEQAAKVLAEVGERRITLGEYAKVLERMDRFERLRYQSADRRRDLLNEMIEVELLAREAERRGLDKLPATRQRMRQVLREGMLRELRSKAPELSEIPDSEVRRYYEAHKQDFFEPERRRVAHIVLKDRSKAEQVLQEALKADPPTWGELVRRHSIDPEARNRDVPLELAGDLGIVTRAGDPRSADSEVPDAICKAVFALKKSGDVYDQLVTVESRHHIVRMISRTRARQRSYEEAERAVRVSIVRRKIEEAERQMEQKLREKYPVTVDHQALERLELRLSK